MHRGQRRLAEPGFGGIIKAAQTHILRHPLSHSGQRLHQVGRHKIVCADENLRQLQHIRNDFHEFLTVILFDDEAILNLLPSHQHGQIKGGIALKKGLAMIVISNEPDLRKSFPQHIIDKPGNFGKIIHIELVGGKVSSAALGGAVHEQNGDAQAAEHFVIVPVKHLNAQDGFDLVEIHGNGQGFVFQFHLRHPMGVHGVPKLGYLPLEFVQHQRGEMRMCQERTGKQGDFSLISGRYRAFCFRGSRCAGNGCNRACIGKLLIAHLHGFLQNLFSGGVCQPFGVVDGFGYGISGDPQGVGNILNGNFFVHLSPPDSRSLQL